jgi:hypothetical protein
VDEIVQGLGQVSLRGSDIVGILVGFNYYRPFSRTPRGHVQSLIRLMRCGVCRC